jgi:cytochrome c
MDSFEWNKIVGAILGTLLFVVALKIGSEMLFEVPEPAKPGYVVPGVPETPTPSAAVTQTAEEALPDFGTLLPKADTAHGQQVSQRCQQCHDLSKGGPDKIGPNLWGVIGRARASRPSFSYSSAMMSDHGPWTFEKLFVYLKSPATMVPGTKMSFAGLPSAQDRIDLIAYLRTQSDSPVPIPPPAPPKAAAATPAATPAAPSGQAAAPAATPAPQTPDFAAAIPAADVAAGKATSQQCEQCHDLSKGGPNKIGPNLWGVVDRPRATHPGFSYSSAMSASHDPWSYDNLFVYLESPQTMVPGTKMSFAGIKSTQQRINLIAYLRTLADSPAPLPAASRSGAPAKPGKGT